eukprot:Awhi_evm1s12146
MKPIDVDKLVNGTPTPEDEDEPEELTYHFTTRYSTLLKFHVKCVREKRIKIKSNWPVLVKYGYLPKYILPYLHSSEDDENIDVIDDDDDDDYEVEEGKDNCDEDDNEVDAADADGTAVGLGTEKCLET